MSAAATLYVAFLSAPSVELGSWQSCSNAGAGLPWWSPIAVTVLLLLISGVYRIKHRPKPPIETSHPLSLDEDPNATRPEDGHGAASFWRLLPD